MERQPHRRPAADQGAPAEGLLRLPEPAELSGQFEPLHPLRLAHARAGLAQAIGLALTGPLSVWAAWAPEARAPGDTARRRLSSLALGYLVQTGSARVRDLALERSLTALAFLFAVFRSRPSPFGSTTCIDSTISSAFPYLVETVPEPRQAK